MALSCGVVGLPNAGKSTLFKALTNISVLIEGYPFSTIDPNVGMVPLLDERLDSLAQITKPDKLTPAYLEVVDVAGLVQGASKGEGLGNQFLGHLRDVDALIQVVGDFGYDMEESSGEATLLSKIEIVNQELIFADIASIEKRKEKIEKKAQSGEKDAANELKSLEKMLEDLFRGYLLVSREMDSREIEVAKELNLITSKKMMYVINTDEDNLQKEPPQEVIEYAKSQNSPVITICAKLESELQELDEEERELFKEEYDLQEGALPEVVKTCQEMLGLITFFTIKGEETRAWLIENNSTALEAAGKIHTDMQRGFIAVEVIDCESLFEISSWSAAKEKGKIRVEGKNYIVSDGDVLQFRFSV